MTRTLSATLACTVATLALPLMAWAAPCGNITYIGCCSGATAKYCKSGSLVTKDCTKDKTYGPNCGWVTKLGFYTCNKTVTKDPKGKYERDCSKLPPKPDGGPPKDSGPKKDSGTKVPCGNITYKGCCSGTTAKYCSSGTLKTKDCSKDKTNGPNCGWVTSKSYYSCNKTATKDPSGKYLRDCNKQPDAGTTKKDTGTKPGCGAIKSQGCCAGETVKWCSSGKLNTKSCASKPKCGWDSTKKYYTCGTKGQADPASKYPMKCPGGTTKDSGTKKDTGPTKQDGAVTKQDTGSTKQDTGTTGGGETDDEGCSCAVTGQPASGALLMLLLGLLLISRRRRS